MISPSNDYYTERLARFGPEVQALGWGSVASQRVRFQVLAEIAGLRNGTILDYGCGLGDLYEFLGRPDGYAGYDCHRGMLEAARARYPSARFVDQPVEADYVLASGVLNLDHFWQDTLREMWGLCRYGLAVNFTSELAERHNPEILYFNPFTAGAFVATLTKKFTIRHDGYLPNDFTAYAYR
jgi:SAM-dependent methyltransferase